MSIHPNFPYQLYLVISEKDCIGKDLFHVAEQSILGGVDVVQLREKTDSTGLFLQKAEQLKEITTKYNIPLIINDHTEVAEKVCAEGIHVGNNDIPPSVLKQLPFFKNRLIGYSIEYLSQLQSENTQLSDYLGISPVFSTNTKTDTVTEWGIEGIETIRALTSKPLIAIGNINLQNTRQIIKAGANSIAVVSAICASEDPQKAAWQLKNEILK
ncbi:thiamine phosphate synthase [Chryseobacterium sp.]|uniref:thiamine phosphate synthase n=1 Tax=Chryseobacterium sp. TaxID=1871047 RepID=UPI0025BFE6A1|nr:thiamine phosphate synthase [Chryseobacterium sp.]